MKPKAFIIDLENCLIEKEYELRKTELRFLKRLGIQMDADTIRKLLSASSIHFWKYICRKKNLNLKPESYLQTFDNSVLEHMDHINIGISKEGLDLISRILNLDIPIVINSSSSKYRAEQILKRANIPLNNIGLVGSEACVYYKPHAEIYYRSLDFLQETPSNCVAIESQQHNIVTAQNSGIHCIYYNRDENDTSIKSLLLEVNDLREIIPESIKLPMTSDVYL